MVPTESSAREASTRRTHETLVRAAAQVFVERGVQAPIREIAGRAGVGLGTVYRHFPTRAELVVAVYTHQIDECAALAEQLTESAADVDASARVEALSRWIDAFVEFLVTKHGLGAALQSDDAGFASLHELMLDRLVPACDLLVSAAIRAGSLDPDVTAYTLMRAVGNLSLLGPGYGAEDARGMVARLLAGCRHAGR